jgi:hypothetical protein
MAAVAMFFAKVDEKWYMKQVLVPSPRCLTVLSWLQVFTAIICQYVIDATQFQLQNVYRYAFLLFGRSLYLGEHLPEPKELFSGSVWTAFYSVAISPGKPLPNATPWFSCL